MLVLALAPGLTETEVALTEVALTEVALAHWFSRQTCN
jgi:hypothetical protein